MKQFVWSIVLAGCLAMPLMADDEIRLPAPQKSGGMTLLEALSQRKTTHRVQGAEPSLQQIANVLWAANGITRPDGKRTAPSAMNRQEIEIAVLTAQGLYEWDEEENELERVETTVDLSDQLRGASMLLIFTYDDEDQSPEYAQVDCGFVGQNVYLYCTTQQWPCVFLGSIDRPKLARALDCKTAEVLYGMRIGVR
ncbi:MAG: nitroreductase family protein [Kiritimatiellae bacterium]|nr:nitroreductase family protein [Kiritimatiellia bacterium]